MANMAYCRFENTLADLRDCQTALDNGDFDNLDANEREAAELLIAICKDIGHDYGDLVQ